MSNVTISELTDHSLLDYLAMSAIINMPDHVKREIAERYFGHTFTFNETDVRDKYALLRKASVM